MEGRKFRKPAMLEPKEAEQIVGEADPAQESEIAHTSAWALMGVANADFNQEAVDRLVKTVREQGVDVIACLWDRSPDFTLPGALWRIYLLWQWQQMNPVVLQERFAEGLAALDQQGRSIEQVVPLGETIRAVEGVLAGYANEEELAPVFEAAATAMRVMAAGITYGPQWITDDRHALAHPVTRRPRALLDTAAELDESAQQARRGTLE